MEGIETGIYLMLIVFALIMVLPITVALGIMCIVNKIQKKTTSKALIITEVILIIISLLIILSLITLLITFCIT